MTETTATEPAERHRFPCAQCGAQLRFTPGQKRLTCQYCGHEQEIPYSDDDRSAALEPLDLAEAMANRLPADTIEETRVLNCDTCGAQVEFDPAVHALQCPFCASPVVADTGTHRQIKPQAVLPFRLTEREAHAQMNRWLKGLWFAPSGLQKYARSDSRLDGLYVPYWAFDAFTATKYTGERGDAYYENKVVNGKSRRVRKIRWHPARGHVERQFHDVLTLAAKSLPPRYTRNLEPWMLGELSPYQPEFLSGFRAEAYTVDLPESHTEAVKRMDEVIGQDIRRDIGGDEQRIHSADTMRRDEKVKHLLLPIWLAAYRYRGKSYRFVVNGQSGKVQGERPWSIWKIAGAIAAVVAVIAGFIYVTEFM